LFERGTLLDMSDEGRSMETEVKIKALMVDPNSGTPIIILKEKDTDFMIPIWVGAFEANAIALEIEKMTPQRPMTHDLLRNIIVGLGAVVERVVITDLIDNTFFASIQVKLINGDKLIIDARPSDAIALALRVDCLIFVNESVIASTKHSYTESAEETEIEQGGTDVDEWPDVIGEVGDLPM
jgi:uncharacterized protein